MKQLYKNKLLRFIVVCAFAFAGGFAGQLLNTNGIAKASSSSEPIFLYGDDGKVRLQMGMYAGAGEKGLPLVGMSDNSGRLRMLFRLAGGNESPVIIMKDTSGRDRLVMGLDLSGTAQSPFFSVVDENGKKTNLVGNF